MIGELHIPLKTSREVAEIGKSCRLAFGALLHLKRYIQSGISTKRLDRIAEAYIRRNGAIPAAQKHFPGAICASVNQAAVHGIPSEYRLKEGDLVTLDVAVTRAGWCGDAAASFLVGRGSPDAIRLLKAARLAVLAGVRAVRAGVRLGEVGRAVARAAEDLGCAVAEECVGHGIGRALHEAPAVPHSGSSGDRMRIVPGLVITVEPVLSLGSAQLKLSSDGWAFLTVDRSPAAQFEHTVAVFKDYTKILTVPDDTVIDFPAGFY